MHSSDKMRRYSFIQMFQDIRKTNRNLKTFDPSLLPREEKDASELGWGGSEGLQYPISIDSLKENWL